jgi:hypothetical protein
MKTGFLEESPGVKSSIRLMSLIVLLFTLGFVYMHVIYNRQPIDANFIALVTLLLTAAFVPKVLQKNSEALPIITNKTE